MSPLLAAPILLRLSKKPGTSNRYHHPPPNLKFAPARMMFSLSWTVVLVPPQLAKPQDALARSTNRYSALAVQFGAKAYSRPTPAVQPASVELMSETRRRKSSGDGDGCPFQNVPGFQDCLLLEGRPGALAAFLTCLSCPAEVQEP